MSGPRRAVRQYIDAGATHIIFTLWPPFKAGMPTRLAEELIPLKAGMPTRLAEELIPRITGPNGS